MESDQRSEWNHGNAVYGIKPQELYSIRASRNAMRDFVGVPYNARGALIPYQTCGLDNKKGTFDKQKFLFCCLILIKRSKIELKTKKRSILMIMTVLFIVILFTVIHLVL